MATTLNEVNEIRILTNLQKSLELLSSSKKPIYVNSVGVVPNSFVQGLIPNGQRVLDLLQSKDSFSDSICKIDLDHLAQYKITRIRDAINFVLGPALERVYDELQVKIISRKKKFVTAVVANAPMLVPDQPGYNRVFVGLLVLQIILNFVFRP